MKISFSTLSCSWPLEDIVKRAAEIGYEGIEVRGIQDVMFLPKIQAFLPENISGTKRLLKDYNIEICGLGTSCRFDDPQKLEASIDEGKQSIDLAAELGCPYIRVFGDAVNRELSYEGTVLQITNSLYELGEYSNGKDVIVLLETHGSFSKSDMVRNVIEKVKHPNVAVLWDIEHPFKHGESIRGTYDNIGKYVRHLHIKDAVTSGEEVRLCNIGEGNIPIRECISLLNEKGFDGYVSLEWEQKWKPYLEPIDKAVVTYYNYVRSCL